MEYQRTFLALGLLVFSALALASPLIPALNLTYTTSQATVEAKTVADTSQSFVTDYATTKELALVQAPISLQPRIVGFVAPKGKCSQFTLPITLASGSILNLKLTSTKPANVYVFATYVFQTSNNGCTMVGTPLTLEANFTAYTLHWTAPQDGTFYLILTGPTTMIMLIDQGSSHPVKELANVTSAMSTQTSLQEFLSMTTTTATLMVTSTQPLLLSSTIRSWPVVISLAILLACAILAIAVLGRRSKK